MEGGRVSGTCPQISRRNEKGETLLHVAAIEGNLALVRQLTREAGSSSC